MGSTFIFVSISNFTQLFGQSFTDFSPEKISYGGTENLHRQ